MIKIFEFDNCEVLPKAYGGVSCVKECIEFIGKRYLLKYPGNLKNRNMKNVNLSYSNSSVCEYIGSLIYNMLSIESHETILGYSKGKLCVACKDFLNVGDELYEFSKLKVTGYREYSEPDSISSDGNSTDLNEILRVIDENNILSKVKGAKNFFWKMFIVDAFIGNPDRNNGNWGVIYNRFDGFKLAPVYDNGSCLNNKWDDEKMLQYLNDEELFKKEAYNGKTCWYTLNGSKVNPYHVIMKLAYNECNNALVEIVPKIELRVIFSMLDDLPVLSEVQKDFYKKILSVRYNEVLLPTYELLSKR